MADPGFSGGQIKVVEALGHVRARPAMYVGNVHDRGLHELLVILLEHVVDDARRARCASASITLEIDGSVVFEDDGWWGRSVELHERVPTLHDQRRGGVEISVSQ